jgi:hypothetical protein
LVFLFRVLVVKMLPAIFIAIWVLTLIALLAYVARVVIRFKSKKLGYQTPFLNTVPQLYAKLTEL